MRSGSPGGRGRSAAPRVQPMWPTPNSASTSARAKNSSFEATWLGIKRPSSGRLASVFIADQPKAPACIASWRIACIWAISFSVPRTLVRDASTPIT